MKEKNNFHGIGFWGLLQIAFIILKLSNVWNVSWIIVFLPTIAPLILCAIFVVIGLVVLTIKDKIDGKNKNDWE